MKTKITILLFALVSPFIRVMAQAQGGLEIPNYTAHSPNVAALGQYGEYKVEQSTGVPSISIPLYTIKGGKLELPISLSYHASGIKLDQESSFVGLGWTLNAGGAIARVVRDKADEGSWGFLITGKSIPNYNSIDELDAAGKIGNNAYLASAVNLDKEPDNFSVNTNLFRDEFCLDSTGRLISMNLDSNKYTADFVNNIIIAKDKVGNTYRFGKALDGTATVETSITNYSSVDDGVANGTVESGRYISGYYLSEIISADNSDTIFFKYKKGHYLETKVVNTTRYILDDGGQLSTIDANGQNFDATSITSMTTTIPDVQVLDKVLFRNGSLEFTSADDRLDYPGNPGSRFRITGFNVFDSKRNLIQTVAFLNNSYFERTAWGKPLINIDIPEVKKKSLKLNGVAFYDKKGMFINDFKFEYDATPLPPRNTTPQDFWGYYNGKTNETLIPRTFYTKLYDGSPVYVGSNRDADFNYMKAGSLKKITYPTGGYTVYDFEPNYYLNKQQQENKVERLKSVSLYAINRLPSCDLVDFLNGVPANNSLEFTITEDIGSSSTSANLTVSFSGYKYTQNAQSMTFKLTNLSNNSVYNFEQSPSEKGQRKTVNQQITIHPGDRFRLEARTNGVTESDFSICNSPYIESLLTYKYWEVSTIENVQPIQAGGLRVKRISNYESNDSIITRKMYEYGDTKYNVGVGELITTPGNNFYRYPKLYTGINASSDLVKMMWFSSESQVELGYNKGCPVNYTMVQEKLIAPDGTPNGKTEYYYNRAVGDYEPKSSWKYPYNTIIYPSWRSNDLLKVKNYKYENNNFVPVSAVEYEYNELPVRKVKILKLIEYEPDLYHAFNGVLFINNPSRFYYYNYYVSCGKILRKKEISKEYVGTDSIVVETSYEYNKYHDINRVLSVNSKQESTETITKYTGDINYNNLISKNILALPIQQERRVNGNVTFGNILTYNEAGNVEGRAIFYSSAPVAPVAYTSYTVLPPLYKKMQSLVYNSTTQNVREIIDESTFNTIYLWSYSRQFPIAEIKNASSATISAILGSANIAAFETKSPTDEEVNLFLAPLRSDARLKTAKIITYTYSPLVGMTSMTDIRRYTSYYEYDGLGRLRAVKDGDGAILKLYEYKYGASITQ
ncbi:hypothetical protein [Chitinophaga pinensis]|uniref:YD repeat protein n=1 Tax=Chitinophaga pinensis (strain ATCC 43595 / DSM 2588 / LMG 13176 / NBRC 15968 / NCIMB 11800 / UQM 2034) TaxID=485918 RepID=A0A979G1B3_CHIPD|nr:hypothetical protein [Chitinophaga pinensis]ACU58891.1 YD repeat protein [Chitinophaga pinensis DSM 2588]